MDGLLDRSSTLLISTKNERSDINATNFSRLWEELIALPDHFWYVRSQKWSGMKFILSTTFIYKIS